MEMPQRSKNRMMSKEMILNWPLMVVLILTQQLSIASSAVYMNEACKIESKTGICKPWSECPGLKALIEVGEYSIQEVVRCGFSTLEEIICCPIVKNNARNEVTTAPTISNGPNTSIPQIKQEESKSPDKNIDNFQNTDDLNFHNTTGNRIFRPDYTLGKPKGHNGFIQVPPPPPLTAPATAINVTERPAIRACKRITEGLSPAYFQRSLGGTDAKLGEFPHMAAIGYSRRNALNGPYYDLCAGCLIDTRFVLTAAHCFDSTDYIPRTVIMGLVNLTDPVAWRDAVVIRIKKYYIHAEYSPSRIYNDIAIIELEQAIPGNKFIHPVCLYTDAADPNEVDELWVTGWGQVNTSTKIRSDNLQKSPLHVTPLERCNARFTQDIIDTQLCAEGKEQIKDACLEDSGGPLNLVVNATNRNYRLVGVVSSGVVCGNATPSLYTRVASFLDFIERIVWPNGGD